MKKIIYFIAGLLLLPSTTFAVETFASSGHLLGDSDSFTLARAMKLGRSAEGSGSGLPKDVNLGTEGGKEKYDCTRDSSCPNGQKCNTSTNKCASTCDVASCSSGTFCVASGEHDYSCKACTTSSHCGGGKYCNNYSCSSCSRGDSCNCPSGQVANGSGGCYTRDPCEGVTCSGGRYCSGGSCYCSSGTWNGSSCYVDPCAGVSCPGGYCSGGSCGCYSGYSWNGSSCVAIAGYCTSNDNCSADQTCSGNRCTTFSCGSCQTASNHTCVAVSGCCTSDSQCGSGQKCGSDSRCFTPACINQNNCGSGQECINGGTTSAYCKSCGQGSSGSFCNCPSGQVATGSGGCTAASCSAGQYMSGSTCVNCSSGTYSKGGTVTSCSACSTLYTSLGSNTCTSCSTTGTCTGSNGGSSGGSGSGSGQPWDYGYPCTSGSQCSRNMCAPSYNSSGQWIPQGSTCR